MVRRKSKPVKKIDRSKQMVKTSNKYSMCLTPQFDCQQRNRNLKVKYEIQSCVSALSTQTLIM
jgi:hypothetical protein